MQLNNAGDKKQISDPARTSDAVMFVHSALDDYGLTPAAFRLLGHVARRAGTKPGGRCYAGINSMAMTTGLHPNTIKKALRELLAANIFAREPRPGETWVLRINPATKWKKLPPPKISPPKNLEGDTCQNLEGEPPKKMVPEGYPPKDIQERGAAGAALSLKEATPAARFIETWKSEFLRIHGAQYFDGGAKDLQAAKRVVAVGMPFDELLKIARWAWRNAEGFHRDRSVSISGFVSVFNELRAKFKASTRVKPRTNF